ncbi:hypothetical protein [Methyloceanibacter caenitepidi]|uniref:Uncharacterized protein n=1 Tax=Methyloceanibacter caenitepidi TaxID=1384459 RepID=A0A0A8K2G8_9HYPH|nr:hypothetical protein [Methyloceanibacter caenitepidi]BAQ16956.1 hypothetical protein GL4_1500 [Methyloceanibacter caenitepidi]
MTKGRSTELSHRESAKIHAINRLWQRAGIVLSSPDYEGLCEQIGATVEDDCLVEVPVRDETVVAVWSAELDCIVTFFRTPTPNQRSRVIGLEGGRAA